MKIEIEIFYMFRPNEKAILHSICTGLVTSQDRSGVIWCGTMNHVRLSTESIESVCTRKGMMGTFQGYVNFGREICGWYTEFPTLIEGRIVK